MSRFIARGYTANELAILNQAQKHQQVLFLSDILGAGGGSVDKRSHEVYFVGEIRDDLLPLGSWGPEVKIQVP
jgi:hypothetical protein